MNLGKAIKLIRVQRDMNQVDLARKAGVTDGYISLLERNLRDPGFALICSISGALEVPVSTLIKLAEEDAILTKP